MRKILSVLAVAAIAFSGCTKKTESFKLVGSESLETLTGETLYFFHPDSREPLDSVVVADKGAFEKEFSEANLTNGILIVYHKGSNMVGYFFAEEGTTGTLTQDPDNVQMPFLVSSSSETSLTSQLNEYTEEVNKLTTPILDQVKGLYAQMNELTDDAEKATLMQEIGTLNDQLMEAQTTLTKKYYQANLENDLGAYLFDRIIYESDEEWIAAYEAAPEHIKNLESNKKRYASLKAALETVAGSQYKDYTIDDGEGNTVQLSEYLSDGRYLLVDFWASWCGPCRNAMPHLAKLNKEHAKTLRVLSIGVWEQSIEDNNKAKADLNMDWETLFDKESVGPQTYGVTGIPTLLLISPEGEILVRTHSPEDVDQKLAELKL